MKSALVQGFKAFVSQVRQNRLEHATNICEKAGYVVQPAEKPAKSAEKK